MAETTSPLFFLFLHVFVTACCSLTALPWRRHRSSSGSMGEENASLCPCDFYPFFPDFKNMATDFN